MSAAKPIADAPASRGTASAQPLAQALVEELRSHRLVLLEIRDELRSWRQPAPVDGPVSCAHPEEARQDLGSMGAPWVRCRACKETLSGGPS